MIGKLSSASLLILVLVACSGGDNAFKIDGRLQNLNQGEFYVYSTDGVIDGIDTIFVNAGRFTYRGTCERSGTLIVVFPNFSEQPVFVQPGKNIKFAGDASHLKELRVSGTPDNKLMNTFRERTKDARPDEMQEYVREFVASHPESIASVWLVNKYFIKTVSPDYAAAAELLETALAAQPDNGLLAQNLKRIKTAAATSEGNALPAFRSVTVSGDTITDKSLRRGDAVVYLFATYDYESCNIQRMLKNADRDGLHLLGICLDASVKECQRTIERDKIETPVVCDGMAFDGELAELLGATNLPDNIILKDGKITARGLTVNEIRQRFPANNDKKHDTHGDVPRDR
ncbi:MAG: DUF4369 domain-containing protein [Prevotella sp.]|nr:DUF4369 domain-containing protein [Prevotella sp.]